MLPQTPFEFGAQMARFRSIGPPPTARLYRCTDLDRLIHGHNVPDDIVIRRYHAGLRNLFQLYMPIVDDWMMFDNSPRDGYALIASRRENAKITVANESIWKLLQEQYA